MKIKTLSSALLFTALFSASASADIFSGKIKSVTYFTETVVVALKTVDGEHVTLRMETVNNSNPREGHRYQSISDISVPLQQAMELDYTLTAFTTDGDSDGTGQYYLNGFKIIK